MATQRPTGPVSEGQRPEVTVQKASAKRASTLQAASQSACSLTGTARQKPLRLFGPSVAPVVLFVWMVSPLRWSSHMMPRGGPQTVKFLAHLNVLGTSNGHRHQLRT